MSENTIAEITNNEVDVKLEKLLDNAIIELQGKIAHNNEETEYNERVIREFGLLDYYTSIPEDIMNLATDFNMALHAEDQKLVQMKSELVAAQLKTYLNSLNAKHTSLEQYSAFIQREIERYENEYIRQCHNSYQDGIDFTNLQTSIHKLQAEIHQANEQQEPKSIITSKLFRCFEISKEITQYQEELENIKKKLTVVRHLPPNLAEAEKKLNELKKKYKQVSNEFTKKVSK